MMGRPANTPEKLLAPYSGADMGACWPWHGSIAANGYGKLTIKKKHLLAHRVAYEHFKGAIPEGLVIDHLCRNKCCVNPDHLEAVQSRENTLRAHDAPATINIWKTVCDHGHPLTDDNVYIRRRGHRVERHCKTCRAEATARWQAKRRN